MTIVTVTAAVFCIGLYGVLTRRDIIAILASVELMMGAANVQLVAYAATSGVPESAAVGQGAALAILVLAAAEAAVGLALLMILVRRTGRGAVDELTEVDG